MTSLTTLVPWAVLVAAHSGIDREYRFECMRCGAIKPVALPIGLQHIAELGNAFTAKHLACGEKGGAE